MRQQVQSESAELNIRGMDPNLVEQVKIAALRRGGRAALRNWVTQALARALRQEAEPRKAPRIFLCAHCVAENRKRTESFQIAPLHNPTTVASEGDRAGADLPRRSVSAPASIAKLLEKVRANEPGPAPIISAPGAENSQGPLPGAAESIPAAGQTAVVPQPPSLPKHRALEVAPGVWVGSDEDYEGIRSEDREQLWSALHAAKEPWHREMVGYKTQSAPECEERLVARRGNEMALNLIDVRMLGPGAAHYVPEAVIRAGMDFVDEQLAQGRRVIIHAASGKSRAAAIALLWMQRRGLLPPDMTAAMEKFRRIYPRFEPGAGIRRYLESKSADVWGGVIGDDGAIANAGSTKDTRLPGTENEKPDAAAAGRRRESAADADLHESAGPGLDLAAHVARGPGESDQRLA